MFLGCKVGETSRWLSDVIVVAYKLLFKWDPSASKRIKQKVCKTWLIFFFKKKLISLIVELIVSILQEVYDTQKDLILKAERLVLATLAFNMNIEHPYKPLVWALKKLEISDKELTKVAWNYVNDW